MKRTIEKIVDELIKNPKDDLEVIVTFDRKTFDSPKSIDAIDKIIDSEFSALKLFTFKILAEYNSRKK